MPKKRISRFNRYSIVDFDVPFYKEKNMNNSYKFSFVSAVVGFIFAVIAALFLFAGNNRFHEVGVLIALIATSLSVFTCFNLIPTSEEKDIQEERRDHDINHRFESVWRELDRVSERVEECKLSCKTSGKSR